MDSGFKSRHHHSLAVQSSGCGLIYKAATITALFSGVVVRTGRVNVKKVTWDQASKSEQTWGCSLQGSLQWGSGNSCEGCQLVTEHELKGISHLGKGRQSPPTTATWPAQVLQHPELLYDPETLFLVAKTPSEPGFRSAPAHPSQQA